MMAAILNSAILNLAILESAILVFPLKLTHTCQDWFPPFAQKKPSLIHSDSTWWWQPSWILPCWIQTPSYLLSDSLKNTLTPLWLWLKLIQSDSNSFILTQLDDGSHLEFHHLEFCHLGFSHFVQKLSLKLIQSDWNSFILTQLDDGSHLEFCHLEFGHLGFSHLSFSSQTHSHLSRWVPTICTKKTFTHSFWLNLMMAATLNSTMLGSDTAILDSDPFLSSLIFTQKHLSVHSESN